MIVFTHDELNFVPLRIIPTINFVESNGIAKYVDKRQTMKRNRFRSRLISVMMSAVAYWIWTRTRYRSVMGSNSGATKTYHEEGTDAC
ncbi:hypothetical protein TNCV_3446111 [Trichonephila clavipes]|nr:hypothetical protein TNCV_3446111 [Trichonephila clavipes]